MTADAFLLDSHVLLWALYDSAKLPERYRTVLAGSAQTFVSAATVWEVEIKKKNGALPVPDKIWEQCAQTGHQFLPIDTAHARAAAMLPLHHRDPFDRMLIAQARLERLTIVTVDRDFAKYDVSIA